MQISSGQRESEPDGHAEDPPCTPPAETAGRHSVHPTALVETARIGPGTRIWAYCHILDGCRIGRNCNLGDHTYVEGGVVIGDSVTVKNGVSIWDGVVLEDYVFVGPNVAFTNDLRPRSKGGRQNWAKTRVCTGASIGANATVLPGVTIGSHALVGAGSVVTHDVSPHRVVTGNPARATGWVCVCARKLEFVGRDARCVCGERYRLHENSVSRAT